MIEYILIVGITTAIAAVITFLITKRVITHRLDFYENAAKAKAKAIEHEAELVLHKSKLMVQEQEFESKRKAEEELMRLRALNEDKRCEIERKEHDLLKKLEMRQIAFDEKERQLSIKVESIDREINFMQKLEKAYEDRSDTIIALLEKQASLTKEEAQKHLIEEVNLRYKAQMAIKLRKIEQQDKKELQKKAAFILAQATTRFAGTFASERLVNSVTLPSDDLKGRIIGKEGRNIKALENILGVDIIIDETPNVIELSSHNLYRRAIATKVIELLLEDGRIQPARIEEIYEKVNADFESSILEEGEQVIASLGLSGINTEIAKLVGKLRYRASYGQNALAHTLEVAHFSGIIAAQLGGDETLAKRAGLLHDIGKAMTHDIGGNHVDIGADICNRYSEDPVVINAIYAHHDQEEVKSIECAAVCAADALSAARPGARREVLESYLKRVKDIEAIALSYEGVKQAYAINSGREVRVILNAKLVNDAQASILATQIATEIENNLQYPGDVKVHAVREERFVAFAK